MGVPPCLFTEEMHGRDAQCHLTTKQMENRRSNPLALRDNGPDVPGSNIVFTHSDHQPHYSVDTAALGDFAIQWTADRFKGMFSITDLPSEWVAFIQNSIHGPWREMTYNGAAPFSVVLWNSEPGDDRISEWIFSQVNLNAGMLDDVDGVLGTVIDSIRDAEMKVAKKPPLRLPFLGTLALPDQNSSTL